MNWKDKFSEGDIYFETRNGLLYNGHVLDILKTLPNESVNTIITSPPYWGLRDYGEKTIVRWEDGEYQLGLEPTLEMYIDHMLQITAELKRVLKEDGVMFWNHEDSYSGGANIRDRQVKNRNIAGISFKSNIPQKCMIFQNYRLIIRMIDKQDWILRNIIIWYKPNHIPSSVSDRFTNAYEPVFMLVKSKKVLV